MKKKKKLSNSQQIFTRTSHFASNNFIFTFFIFSLLSVNFVNSKIDRGFYVIYHTHSCTDDNLVYVKNRTDTHSCHACGKYDPQCLLGIDGTMFECISDDTRRMQYVWDGITDCYGSHSKHYQYMLYNCKHFGENSIMYHTNLCEFDDERIYKNMKDYVRVRTYNNDDKQCSENIGRVDYFKLNACILFEADDGKFYHEMFKYDPNNKMRRLFRNVYNDSSCTVFLRMKENNISICEYNSFLGVYWKWEVFVNEETDYLPIIITLTIASVSIFFIIVIIFVLVCFSIILFFGFVLYMLRNSVHKDIKSNSINEVDEEVELFVKYSNDSDDLFLQKWKEENMSVVERIKLVDFKSINLISYIGSGGSGCSIFLANWTRKEDGKVIKVAFKSFPVLFEKIDEIFASKNKTYNDLKRELSIYINTSHPFVLKLHSIVLQKKYVGLIMDYCECGDIKRFLIKNKEISLHEKMIILFKICSGMAHLHFNSIIHRDLKLGNILIDQNYNPKIMDFGISKLIQNSMTKTKNIGTVKYQAPELVLSGSYDEKVDVFSFGILSFEMLTLNFDPFNSKLVDGNLSIEISTKPNFRPNIKELPNDIPDWFVNVIKSSWDHEPSTRPSFVEICKLFKKNFDVKQELNIFNEKLKKDPITIYIKNKGEKDIDAIDVDLNIFKFEELKRLACSSLKNVDINYMTKISLQLLNGESIAISNDKEVEMLKNDSIVVFE